MHTIELTKRLSLARILPGAAAALLLLAGCAGGSGPEPGAAAQDADQAPAGGLTLEKQGFALRVMPESFVDGGSAELELRLFETAAGGSAVEVCASAAQGLKALYFELDYDAGLYSPQSAGASGLLAGNAAGGSELLELSILDEPGRITCGQVLAGWDRQQGFSGAGSLARIEFTAAPFNPQAARSTSAPPQRADALTMTSYQAASEQYALLMMFYNNPGDYDQNGIVGITDLTPLGQHIGELGIFAYNSIGSVVDGNHDGLISISDITPIGANFGARIAGYNAYCSADSADYPQGGTGPNGPGALQVAYRSFESYSKYPDFRSNGGVGVANPMPGGYFWLRPTDGESEGIAGNLVQESPSGGTAPQLELQADSLEGQFPLRVHFSSLVENPDGDFLAYRLLVSSPDVDGDAYSDFLELGPYSDFSYEFARPGIYTVELSCYGTDGLGASDNLVITVSE